MKKTIKTIAMLALVLGSTKAIAQNAAINSSGSAPDASAMLDVSSTTKGLLTPRMTAVQRAAITSPATGLIVYQTDGTDGFYYYDGAGWVMLITGNASDLTSGTVGTARLGSGTADNTTYLRGDGTWNSVSAAFPNVITASGNIASTALPGGETTFATVKSITLPSTGVYLITAYASVTPADAGVWALMKMTQGGTTLAMNDFYNTSSNNQNGLNVSMVVNITSIASDVLIEVASYSAGYSAVGKYSVVKLSN